MSHKNILGFDLGGTELRFSVAHIKTGVIIAEANYDSPFKKTGKELDDGSKQVLLDILYPDIRIEDRVSLYLQEKQADFLKNTDPDKIAAEGASLCGKVWVDNCDHYVLGGNTPKRFATTDSHGERGILIDLNTPFRFIGANDGNAAANAQGFYYESKGIQPRNTGYIILGTGFGFGALTDTPTELGHAPVSFMHPALRYKCGCEALNCVENYASGVGIEKLAEKMVSLFKNNQAEFDRLCKYEELAGREGNLHYGLGVSDLTSLEQVTTKDVFDAAKKEDPFAKWIIEISSTVTADAILTAAQLYGLTHVGIGESVAVHNPWYVDLIAKKVSENTSKLLPGKVQVEMTPIGCNAGKYGALSLVVPQKYHSAWAKTMSNTNGN